MASCRPAFEYRPFIIKLLTEQVAGYYDTKEQRFRIADWLDLEGQKPVMAHELTHALQDQHFNLRRFEKWPRGDSDAQIAAHALIEGDATLAMTKYMLRYPLVALAFTRSLGTGGISTEQYDLAPRAIRESLIFPYLNGSEWATQVYKRGGWAAISKAYTHLPFSTEQIIHPEKYFSYERPVKIVLPDVSKLLNDGRAMSNQQSAVSKHKQQSANSNQPASGAKKQSVTGTAGVPPAPRSQQTRPGTLASDVCPSANSPLPTAHCPLIPGSASIPTLTASGVTTCCLMSFLSRHRNRSAQRQVGAATVTIYTKVPGGVFLAHLTAWDTENDAREFFDAYVKRTKLRYAGANPVELASSDKDQHRSWETSEGGVAIEIHGARILIIEGLPKSLQAEPLMKALWQ